MTMKTKNQTKQVEGSGLFTKQFWLGVALSCLSGLLMFLAFPPVNIGALMFIAMIPSLVAQYRFMPRKWSALAPTLTNLIWLWPFLYRIF